jgi:hypothetical protein
MSETQEWELTYNFLIGKASGLESYSRYLRQASGDLFAQGKDTEASIYRDLADDAKARSVRKRKEADDHKKRYGKEDD